MYLRQDSGSKKRTSAVPGWNVVRSCHSRRSSSGTSKGAGLGLHARGESPGHHTHIAVDWLVVLSCHPLANERLPAALMRNAIPPSKSPLACPYTLLTCWKNATRELTTLCLQALALFESCSSFDPAALRWDRLRVVRTKIVASYGASAGARTGRLLQTAERLRYSAQTPDPKPKILKP